MAAKVAHAAAQKDQLDEKVARFEARKLEKQQNKQQHKDNQRAALLLPMMVAIGPRMAHFTKVLKDLRDLQAQYRLQEDAILKIQRAMLPRIQRIRGRQF